MVTPEFIFGSQTLAGDPFHFGGLKLSKEVNAYTGLDFGPSNSYAVQRVVSPEFIVSYESYRAEVTQSSVPDQPSRQSEH